MKVLTAMEVSSSPRVCSFSKRDRTGMSAEKTALMTMTDTMERPFRNQLYT